ncbi:MAG: phosphodiester glycosidase family protein [Minicystis sp.]
MRPRPLLALVLLLGGCTCSGGAPSPRPVPSSAPPLASASAASAQRCPGDPAVHEIAPGLFVERIPASIPAPVEAGDHCLTFVRVDPARFRLRLLSALHDAPSRPVPAWASAFGLTGVINASMFESDGRSSGLLVGDGVINNDADNPRFGGYLAFDPTRPGIAPVAFFGRSCPGFDLAAIRKNYRSIVQNYRLLDCDGHAILWQDRKVYSAAVIGQDREGRVVFVHARTPWSMTDLAAMLAAPERGLRDALFVEGGPETSLLVKTGSFSLAEMGSYETGFQEDDRNLRFWDLPNVLGFSPR